MDNIENLLLNYLIVSFSNKSFVEEKAVDEQINEFMKMDKFKNLDDCAVNSIKAKFTSQISIKLEKGILIENKRHKKWFLNKKPHLDMKYWERYRKYLEINKKFPIDVVNKMDDILDSLTDLLGDPDSDNNFQRRGLVIGDVQSGKTSNYTGLICKAADTNYKVVVLLTGTIEKLRRQTQMRLDEGFVGFDSSAMIKDARDINVGVSKFDKSAKVIVLTSTTDDFKSKIANNLIFDLTSINNPVLFVVKKNVSVLKKLNKWLCTFNKNGEDYIDNSLLLIDDEADNASVNTNPEDKNPTAINNQIRDLLNVFAKSSYVGFTATPYANIFIDPMTNELMKNEDLFPKDYIYSLNAPSNYIGARNIFGDQSDHFRICKIFSNVEEDEIEKLLPLKHKKNYYIRRIPSSLKKALAVFLIGNIVRDLRGDINKHRSMLVNMSRFTDVQNQLGSLINAELKNFQKAARIYSNAKQKVALRDNSISYLHNIFNTEFKNINYKWIDIQKNLYLSIGGIKVVVINQKSDDKLNYEEYVDGLRVIVIGGLSLSRGLTLEGLMTSYLYRSTRMYDTLLQMGRWFGYRPNFEDLCTIWLSEESRDWYNHISEATDELKRYLKRYEDSGITPMEFGIRVRSDKNALLVTARNKMRTSEERICTISLSEEVIETTDLYVSHEKTKHNYKVIQRLLYDVKERNISLHNQGKAYLFKNIDKELILDLLDDIEMPITNEYLDPTVISKFISNYLGCELDFWDIAFANGSCDDTFEIDENFETNYLARSFSVIGNNDNIVRMSGKSRRLGTTSDGKLGIEIDTKEMKKNIMRYEYRSKPRNLKQKDYFTYDYIKVKRNPLLVIYNVKLKYDPDKSKGKSSEEKEQLSKYAGKKVIGIGIGIPMLGDFKTKYASYRINKIYQQMENEYDIGEEE